MSIEPGRPVTATVSRLQEWQQLWRTATNQAFGYYLRGCADLAMARTPRQAMGALHKWQTCILEHSANTAAEADRLCRAPKGR
jgi:hypothetical protein